MPFLSQVEETLAYPLFDLSGGRVTLGSLLIGAAVVVGAVFLARFSSATLAKLLGRRGVHDGARFALAKILRYLLLLLGVLVAISSIGFNLQAMFAASAALLLGIGFGLQGIVQNFVGGIILLIERPVGKGDFVRIGDAFGSVVDIGLRATTVVTRDEVTIIVPNSELIGGQVVNHSVPTTNLRVPVKVGVAYGVDTALVRAALLRAAAGEPMVLHDPAPEVRFDDFGDSSLDFTLLVWIANPRQDRVVASGLRFAIVAEFASAGIEIPFPQRDVHIRSDAAGGLRVAKG